MDFNQNELISRAETATENFLRQTKFILPTLGRICLVSTFIEDGFRKLFQMSEHRNYVNSLWGCGWFLASMFVLYNLVAQMAAAGLVVARKHVPIACGVLLSTIVLQVLVYSSYWDLAFLFKNFSLCGALLLLLVRQESKRVLAGLPQLENENENLKYIQLVARILLVMMFLTLLELEFESGGFGVWQILQNIIASALMTLVSIGYKTKLSALVLVFWLTVINLWQNLWFSLPAHSLARDYRQFEFFQTLSVIGGLLFVLALGPGGLSLDERKKRW